MVLFRWIIRWLDKRNKKTLAKKQKEYEEDWERFVSKLYD